MLVFLIFVGLVSLVVTPINNGHAKEGLYPPCAIPDEIDWEIYSAARVDIERKHPSVTPSGEIRAILSTDIWRIMPEEGLVRLQYEDYGCVLLRPDDAEAFVRALRLLATTPDGEKISRRGLAWSLSVNPSSTVPWQIGVLILQSSLGYLGGEIPPNQMNKFADAIERVLNRLNSEAEQGGNKEPPS